MLTPVNHEIYYEKEPVVGRKCFSFFIYVVQCMVIYLQNGSGRHCAGRGGDANVYVTLTPSVGASSNLVVDLSQSITCNDEYPPTYIDYVSLQSGSAFGAY